MGIHRGASTLLESALDVKDEISPSGHFLAALTLVSVDALTGLMSRRHASGRAYVGTSQIAPDSTSFFGACAIVCSRVGKPSAGSVLVATPLAAQVADVVAAHGTGHVTLLPPKGLPLGESNDDEDQRQEEGELCHFSRLLFRTGFDRDDIMLTFHVQERH